VRICWDFALPNRGRFVQHRFRDLLESSRRLIALVRTQSLSTRLPQRAATVRIYFNHLRILLRWMVSEGFRRFDELDADSLPLSKLPSLRAGNSKADAFRRRPSSVT
jgi:hypothetical protein